jgi:4-hydroxy-3-methylbut-2-enyl diphosphate reductase
MVAPPDPDHVAIATQTTLSVDDTAEIAAVLKRRFPLMAAPHKEDICYATTNRQDAVKLIAQGCDAVVVIGSQNSSNSQRLVEVALRAGARDAVLIDDVRHLDWSRLDGARRIGITAGASAPENLVRDLLNALAERFELDVHDVEPTRETVTFKLPRMLAD